MSVRATPARQVHPGAWWLWALGLAVAVSSTTNPLLLAIALSVTCLVVAARRGSSPWARAFRLYLLLGLTIVVLRLLLHVLQRHVERGRAAERRLPLRLTDEPRAFIDLERGLTLSNVSEPDPPAVWHLLLGTHPTTVERIGYGLAFARER